MSRADAPSFEVISRDAHGDPVRCSFCARQVPCVVVLHRIAGTDDEELWVGLCAYCVLSMARALAANSNDSGDSGEVP